MRRRLEASRGRHDLKRGFGGLADLEFIAQFLELALAARSTGPTTVRQAGDLPRTNYLGRAGGSPPLRVHFDRDSQ